MLFLYLLPSPLPRLTRLHHHYTTALCLLPCALNSTTTDHAVATCAAAGDAVLVCMLVEHGFLWKGFTGPLCSDWNIVTVVSFFNHCFPSNVLAPHVVCKLNSRIVANAHIFMEQPIFAMREESNWRKQFWCDIDWGARTKRVRIIGRRETLKIRDDNDYGVYD